ncbi:MAG: molybdate ABC transporter permease subunit, partial [Rhodococcus sp.]|nr:molybdate ABC transporter permease subunit [Rhodococcus sp. (in: high G+C Gram-positive bacteria)]
DRPEAAAAVSVTLLLIAFVTLFILRVVSTRGQKRQEEAK